MADPTKDNDHSTGADELDRAGEEGSAGAEDDFGASFAEEDEEDEGGGDSGDDDDEAGAGDDDSAGGGDDDGSAGDDSDDEHKGEAEKALEARIAERQAAEARQSEAAFWQGLDEGFDGDVDEVVQSPAFTQWLEKQPEAVQTAASQIEDPSAALKVLNDFQAVQAESTKVDTDVQAFLDQAGLADIPIGTGEEGEDPETLAGFVEEYPEIGQAMMVMGQRLSATAVEAALQSGGYMTADQVQAMIDGKSKIQALHTDAKDVVESEGYQAWLEEQAPGVKAMAASADADDQVYVINAYKEHTVKQETPAQKAARAKAARQHRNKKAVHAASVEDGVGAGSGGGGGGSGTSDDFASAWAEDDDDD